jgi:predicted dehydrogenase
MYRHHPQTLKIVDMVSGGKLGKVKLVRGTFTFQLNHEGDIRFDPAMGGGALWDVGCYPLSFARTVIGAEPLEVFGWQVTGDTGIDETFVAQMRFPGEVYAQFNCSFAVPFISTAEVFGDAGRLAVPRPFQPGVKEHILLTHPDGVTDTITIKGQSLYSGEVEDMADAVLLGKTPRVSLADSRANVAAILALLESARTGKPVMI